MERHELEARLGPALDDLTEDQVDRLMREAETIALRHPGPGQEEERTAALSAAVQYLLGELTPEQAGAQRRWTAHAERMARVAAIQVGAMADADGMPTAEAARTVGVDRQVLIRHPGRSRRT